MKPGALNALTDVAGIRVGHTERVGDGYRTGTTVVLAPEGGAVAGVDVRGAAPGTRETELLDPRNLVERVHAIVLTGGSAYGLSAACGVMDRLADAGIGFPVEGGVVPIVPSAVIYDLGRGGDFRATPAAAFGAAAYDAASPLEARSGSLGAGAGAVAGGLAGGLGTASAVLSNGVTVAALAVVNAAGSVLDPVGALLAGTRYGLPGEFAVGAPSRAEADAWNPARVTSFNTTIGVVATDLTLSKAQCGKLAGVAHDGLARAIRPAHTMVDGDTIFAMATCGQPAPDAAGLQDVLAAGADVFSRAVAHAILAATGREGAPAYLDVFPSARSRA
ncbi:P1 family peptidase [Nonomuraea sp. NBC_01738]|uniref:P1 family peptidase n=1 Tax=Nonomuraea sp. NBC_01738 TaxID=2976003 RepID=UPI002E12B39E|nr:P1 family peptidase [Nonomuraea sp. NBC_01738]